MSDCILGSQHLASGTNSHSALGGSHWAKVVMEQMTPITNTDTILKYKNRRLQIMAGLIILNITTATEIFEVERAIIPNGWTIQLSLRTVVIWDAFR